MNEFSQIQQTDYFLEVELWLNTDGRTVESKILLYFFLINKQLCFEISLVDLFFCAPENNNYQNRLEEMQSGSRGSSDRDAEIMMFYHKGFADS